MFPSAPRCFEPGCPGIANGTQEFVLYRSFGTHLWCIQKWRGLAQGFELVGERTEKGKTSIEVVYGITRLKPHQADARLGILGESRTACITYAT